MRSMAHARSMARIERSRVGLEPPDLLQRLERHMKDAHHVAFFPMSDEQMGDSDAEVDLDLALEYRASLQDSKKLEVFAHELGHVVLHGRLKDRNRPLDLILASAYGEAGA